jgi:hypothetical protein
VYRQKHSELLVRKFFSPVYQYRQGVDFLPSSLITTALNHVAKRQNVLKAFLSNPAVSIDTKHLERALRFVPMGRKSYLFRWTKLRTEHLGILQGLMMICRLQDINLYGYLLNVLQRINLYPASKVDELIPRS